MQHLSSDFNVLKQCLKSKELWQKLSDEEKAYCYKAKAKMKASKKLQEEVSAYSYLVAARWYKNERLPSWTISVRALYQRPRLSNWVT